MDEPGLPARRREATDDLEAEGTSATRTADPAGKAASTAPAPPPEPAPNHSHAQSAGAATPAPRGSKRKDEGAATAKVANSSAGQAAASPTVHPATPAPPEIPDRLPPPKVDSLQPPDRLNPSEEDSPARHETQPASTTQATNTPPSLPNPADRPALFPTQPALAIPASARPSTDAWTPPVLTPDAAGLVDRVANDPGLSVTVLPHAAHLAIASNSGDLALHVRVRDGNTDVNVTGTMSPLFEAKAPEVRTVLAGEGLTLGSFATDQHNGQPGQQSQQGQSNPSITERDTHSPVATLRSAASSPKNHAAADRHIHVTA